MPTPSLITHVALVRAADRVSPTAAARLAYPLFRRTRPRLRVRADQQPVQDTAVRATMRARGRQIETYEWGTGERTVLLLHGWRGRAAQFAPIIRELRAEGLRLVAFDAPANGESPGRHTDVLDWLAATRQLEKRHGGFHSIIGHSFGAMAAMTAIKEGVSAGSLVSIAGVSDARFLVLGFGQRVGLSAAATQALAGHFARQVFGEPDPWPRFDAVARPLPASVPLLIVHDDQDREVPLGEAERLHKAHGGRARLLRTSGYGHSRVIGADPTLDAITALLTGGLSAVGELGSASASL